VSTAVKWQIAERPEKLARCVICSGSSQPCFQSAGYWIRECRSCGHRFADVRATDNHIEKTYSDNYFAGDVAGYSDYLGDQRLLIERGRWYAGRVARFCNPGTLLDVGAAAGFTLRGFADLGWDVLGLEPNVGMAEYARTQLQIPVEATALETWNGGHRFDLVSMLQVLPHFFDPRSAIRCAATCLRTGGHLLIELWDRKSWTAQLWGESWHEYNPPSVLHWFSKATLVRLLNSEGFVLVDHGRPSRWISVGHAKSVLRNKTAVSLTIRLLHSVAGLLPEKLAIPYPCDDLFWMLLRLEDVKPKDSR
jgi:2-polyprenyl-3-methyl-5-hydroxy-6-metoxy-1,4-benzoquinol methylase